MRDISLAALTVLELSPVAMVRCAAEAGYSHVGLRLLPATPTEPVWDMVGDTPMVREVAAALADTGVRVLDVEILRLRPETDVRDFEPMLATGARLGARYVLIAGNDPDEARLTTRLAALCMLAAPLGLAIYLEPMPWTDVRDLTQAARIVEQAGEANAGVLIDPIHFDRAGNRAAQIATVPAKRLAYLQFCDAPAERPADLDGLLHQARAERRLPGDGGLDLNGILAAVPAGAPLSLEIPMQSCRLPALERARLVLEAAKGFMSGRP
ncbi:MAG: TIM barrel protein [Burkholderiales bacterium]